MQDPFLILKWWKSSNCIINVLLILSENNPPKPSLPSVCRSPRRCDVYILLLGTMKRAVSEGRLVKSLFWHLLFPRVVLLFCSQSPISTLWKYVFVPWVCKAWYLKLMPFLPRCKNLDYLPPLPSLPWPLSCSLFPWLISCLKTVGD